MSPDRTRPEPGRPEPTKRPRETTSEPTSMRRALITGITGQDGSYLAEFLLGRPDYEVHGLVRRSSSLNRQRIDHLLARDRSLADRFQLHYADLADASSLSSLMEQVRPDEAYNPGAH